MSSVLDRIGEQLLRAEQSPRESTALATSGETSRIRDWLRRPRLAGTPALAPERRGPPARWLPRTAAVALVACALAAGIGVAVFNASSPTTSRSHRSSPVIKATVVSFRYPKRGPDSGYIIATVADPFAAQSSLNAAFKAAGLNIVVTLVPASPSIVGTVTSMSEPSDGPQIQTLVGGSCVTGGGGVGGCPIGLKIPRDFTGAATITLGRPAASGEDYVSTTSAFAPGESLHCSGLLNEQVTTALPQIKADNITAYWGNDPFPANGNDTQTPPSGDEYITDANPVAAGVVWFRTQPQPLTAAEVQQYAQQYNQGC
jgi:hypothetical protein